MNNNQDNQFVLQWNNLVVTHPKDDKHILRNLSGSVRSGRFLTIMGPSGAGKSSLLSSITAQLRNNHSSLSLQGKITLNGKPYDADLFAQIAAFVQQDDILYGTLTVRETFEFTAKLRLWKESKEEQKQACDRLMQRLNLLECQNVLVGNSQFKKTISGGQKKRVAIGIELLSNPKILVLDEPTSGLDSHNALAVLRILTGLASAENKLVIATLHQPSSLMFQSLDQLYLMRKGECFYDGKASGIVGYMQQLGIKVDYRMNPADFMMLEISALRQEQGYQTKMRALNNENVNQSEKVSHSSEPLLYPQLKAAPFTTEFETLCQRSFRNFYRTPSNQLNKLFNATILPAFLATIFKMIAREVPEQHDMRYMYTFMAFLFMSVYFSFAMNTYDTVLIFPSQKQIVLKEVSSKLYGVSTYYCSMLLVNIPGAILPALTGSVITQLITGMDTDSHFIFFMGVYTLSAIVGYFYGIAFGAFFRDSTIAVSLFPLLITPVILFAGLVVNLNAFPTYSGWIQYLSPVRHGLLLVFQDQMRSPNFKHYSHLNLPEIYGLDADPWRAFWWLVALIAGSGVLTLAALVIQSRRT